MQEKEATLGDVRAELAFAQNQVAELASLLEKSTAEESRLKLELHHQDVAARRLRDQHATDLETT